MKLFKLKTTPSWLFTALLVMVFVLPLLFNPWAYDLFEFPKNLWMKSMALIMAGGLVFEYFRGNLKRFHLSHNHQVWLSIFLGILVLSLIVSSRPEISFWGGYVRQGGVINMLFYGLLFVLGLQVFNDKARREKFLQVTMVSGVIVAVYALLQQIGVDYFSASATDIFAGRSYSTLGNPTSLGAYLLFPMGAFMALRMGSKEKPRWWVLLLLFAAIVVAKNRASILAVMLSSGLYVLWLSRKKPVFFWMLFLGGLVSMLGFLSAYGGDIRSLMSRFTTWNSSLEMIKDYPILGIAPENFLYYFDIYAQPDLYLYEDYTTTMDRPHNEFLEWWIHYGIFGALFYIGLGLTILRKFWTTKDISDRFVSLGLIALMLSNFFSFSLVTQLSFAALFLAFIFRDKASINLHQKGYWRWAVAVVLTPIILGFLALNVNAFVQDYHLKQTYVHFGVEEYEESMEHLLKAHRSPFPYIQVYSDSFPIAYSLADATGGDDIAKLAEYFVVMENKLSNYALSPSLNLAKWYIFIENFDAAEEVYKSLYAEGRTHPKFLEKWADFYAEQNQIESAALVYDEFFVWMPNTWKNSFHDSEATRIFWKNHPNFYKTISQAALIYEFTDRQEEASLLLEEL